MNSSNSSSKNQKAKVQVVRCPEVRLPADMAGGRSRPRSSSPSPSSSSSSSSSSYATAHMAGHKRGRERNSRGSDRIPVGFSSSKDIKDELRGYLGEIKDLAATSFSGLKKKKFKEDKLTKLGAPDVKQQKMPFSMKMGIEKGKKRRQAAVLREAKDAGIVLASAKREESSAQRSFVKKDDGIDFGAKVRGGVMHVKDKGGRR